MRVIILVIPLLLALAEPPTSPSAPSATTSSGAAATSSAPVLQPVESMVSPETRKKVERLVRQLSSPKYAEREEAQRQLRRLGEAAMLPLTDYVLSPDLEVAERVSALVVRPKDPAMRVEVAYRLLSTGKPHLMEPAVYMLFEEPLTDFSRFEARAKNATGLARVVCDTVLEEFAKWKTTTEIFRANYEKHRESKPEAAAHLAHLHEGSQIYACESAFQSAVDAVVEYYAPGETPSPPSGPSSRPASRG